MKKDNKNGRKCFFINLSIPIIIYIIIIIYIKSVFNNRFEIKILLWLI